jgi:hypothetical protein
MANLNKARPGVPVVIGGTERQLYYDWWAFSVIEEEKGEGYFQTLGKMTLAKVTFLTWAGLLRQYPELDGPTAEKRREGQRKVAQWCADGVDVAKLAEAVTSALVNSSVKPEAETKNDESAIVAESTG